MRSSARGRFARGVLWASVSAALIVGPIGCGSSGSATGGSSELPPEAKKANENMENFMKTEQQKKP